jgi:hypothetical protein
MTKSHIWPDWFKTILPPTATHHERIIGKFETFGAERPRFKAPAFQRKLRQGRVGGRKPRNTCVKCNGGWMREIEEATMPFMRGLLLGHLPFLLPSFNQRLLASLLCLVSMRVAASSETKQAIPQADRDWLRHRYEPPANWRIWIARHRGPDHMDERFAPMHISGSPDVETGLEYCNSQVSTFVVGKLCAHLFSSTVWSRFDGYEGIELASIWPPSQLDIEMGAAPVVEQALIPWLHEAIGRELGSR